MEGLFEFTLFLLLRPAGDKFDNPKTSHKMYKYCIYESLLQIKKKFMDTYIDDKAVQNIELSQSSSTSSKNSNPKVNNLEPTGEIVVQPTEMPEIYNNYINDRLLLVYDGELNQFNAIINLTEQSNEANLELMKIPATSSFMFQPNDVMKSFMIMKIFVKSTEFNKMKFSGTEPTYMKLLIEKLKDVGIDSASRNTFNNFMLFLPEMLKSAYTKKILSLVGLTLDYTLSILEKYYKKTPTTTKIFQVKTGR